MTPTQQLTTPRDAAPGQCTVNGQLLNHAHYPRFHRLRIDKTLSVLRGAGVRKIVEVGGHPWWMTSRIVDDVDFELQATMSAEEVTAWPEDIGVTRSEYSLTTARGNTATFANYSANVERTLFDIDERPDAVLACEIIEHLIRSPHVMLLNINRWLPTGGKLLITTPNGAQFANPLRRRTRTPAYRFNVYGRHNYVYTLGELEELVSLCGFRIVESDYWSVYERSGLAKLYELLGHVPSSYFKEKFRRTLFVFAEKVADASEMDRIPRVYYPDDQWEHVAGCKTTEPDGGRSHVVDASSNTSD